MYKIKINGKSYPVKMGLNAMRMACKDLNLELDELLDQIKKLNISKFKISDLELIAKLLICGITDGLRKEGESQNHGLTVDDIVDLIESSPDELLNVFTMLGESMPDHEESRPKNHNSRNRKQNA